MPPVSRRGDSAGDGPVRPGQDAVAVPVLADGLDDQLHRLADGEAVIHGLAARDHGEHQGALIQAHEGLDVGGSEARRGLAGHGEGLQPSVLADEGLRDLSREARRADGSSGEGNVAARSAPGADEGRAVARVFREAEETLPDRDRAWRSVTHALSGSRAPAGQRLRLRMHWRSGWLQPACAASSFDQERRVPVCEPRGRVVW